MAECLLLKGGGGADLDVVTAGAGDVLSGKVIVDKDGNPLAGTMPNKTGAALTVATNGQTLIPQGYHDGTQYAKNTQATLAGGTLTPSTSQVTVSCNGKLMTSNYVIPAFSLPSASIIVKGQKVTIYGKSVTGTANNQKYYYIHKYDPNSYPSGSKSFGNCSQYFVRVSLPNVQPVCTVAFYGSSFALRQGTSMNDGVQGYFSISNNNNWLWGPSYVDVPCGHGRSTIWYCIMGYYL